MTMTDAAQRRLYEVFGQVARPERIEVCPHCSDADLGCSLLKEPVSAIAAADLAGYAAKAITTWGGAGDLRYLLPRMLECVVAGAADFPDPEIVLGKLALADWHHWPAEEARAIDDFLHAWWETTLEQYPAPQPVGTVLCSIAAAGIDLDPYLRAWSPLDGDDSIRHLYDFLATDVDWSPDPQLTNAFWNGESVAYRQVLTWIGGGPATRAVEAAFERATSEPVLELLDTIHDWISPLERDRPAVPGTLSERETMEYLARTGAKSRWAHNKRLAKARSDACDRGKEPFDLAVLETLCDTSREGRMDAVDIRHERFEWKYYTQFPDVMTLRDFARKVDELNRWS
ncbi:hypothetical protein G3I60_04185 [Streptomyces sp. SID13666]|uniref:hypothetical protein n=1 Tax=unclassified Streptomyces TaxID=2593676 RepID=UPI0013BF0D2F|nr:MULTISPECIES: hypothetical protein [unclassified Streptomyces]NEA53380.1 hypothetical protein [Streptomyces sp. SID13666]NEA69293.1 hypothetical protein [Streptomyces sp. SID13588]